MPSAGDILGFVGDAIGVVEFAVGLFPEPDGSKSTVRIAAGSASDQSGGTVKEVKLYDKDGNILGLSGETGIGEGQFSDVSIHQPTNNQPQWVDVLGTDDAVCISYVTITWPDSKSYGWVGDFGKGCGLTWYEGDVIVEGDYAPACTWIDGNHEEGVEASHLSIRMPAFTKGESPSTNPSDFCGGDKFHAYRNNDDHANAIFKRSDLRPQPQPQLSSRSQKKQQKKHQPRNFDGELVVSSIKNHNATRLCLDPLSSGPDFVSERQGLYCDMSSREIMPLCTDDIREDCFDLESNTEQKVKRDGLAPRKVYTNIKTWGGDDN